MPELKRGSFNSVMEGLEDEVENMELETETEEEEEQETTQESTDESTEEEEATEEGTEEEEDSETSDEEEESDDEETDTEEDTETEETKDEESEKEEDDDDEPLIWTVKVDGKEEEVDEEELLRGYQTAQASTKRFSEAKKMHQEAQSFFQAFLKDPGSALTDYLTNQTGGDRVKARTLVRDQFLEFLAPDLEESLIEDEKEKELFRQRREIEEQRKELDRQKAEAKSRLDQEAEDEYISDVRIGIEKQLKKYKLPVDSDPIWSRAGKYLAQAEEAGSSREEVKELIPTVIKKIKEERAAEAKAMVATLSAEEIERLFPDQMKELKKKRISKVKEKKSQKTKSDSSGTIAKKQKSEKKKPGIRRSDDIFAEIDPNDF